jgi:hypothetical protein
MIAGRLITLVGASGGVFSAGEKIADITGSNDKFIHLFFPRSWLTISSHSF